MQYGSAEDVFWMQQALAQAEQAYQCQETPVGAVVVYANQQIAAACNQRETLKDPTAHAELLALRVASQMRGGWRLFGCTIYVTLEPCAMCAGALVLARLDRLVFGARDIKAGAAGSIYNIVRDPRLNHQLEVCEGVLAAECAALLGRFFSQLRQQRRGGGGK